MMSEITHETLKVTGDEWSKKWQTRGKRRVRIIRIDRDGDVYGYVEDDDKPFPLVWDAATLLHGKHKCFDLVPIPQLDPAPGAPPDGGFRVGDVVKWGGALGTVFMVDGCRDSIVVDFPKNGVNQRHRFYRDGRFFHWHITPSLKFISRPVPVPEPEMVDKPRDRFGGTGPEDVDVTRWAFAAPQRMGNRLTDSYATRKQARLAVAGTAYEGQYLFHFHVRTAANDPWAIEAREAANE